MPQLSASAYLWGMIVNSPVIWWLFGLGLCLGSFLNVCIYRLPRGEFWQSVRSYCPHCESKIPWYHNIPLLSFIMLRGRAACCQGPIRWRYPLVELLTGLIVVGFFWRYPFVAISDHHVVWYQADLIRYLHGCIFVSVLLVTALIDWDFKIIPDVVSLPMIGLSPLVAYVHPELTWQSSALGVLAGGGIVYAIAWSYYLLRRGYGIGMGDAKLLAAIGGWLGYQALFTTIFYGAFVGSAYGLLVMARARQFSLKTEIPFGPFLALGAFLHMVAGTGILPRLSLF